MDSLSPAIFACMQNCCGSVKKPHQFLEGSIVFLLASPGLAIDPLRLRSIQLWHSSFLNVFNTDHFADITKRSFSASLTKANQLLYLKARIATTLLSAPSSSLILDLLLCAIYIAQSFGSSTFITGFL